MTRLDDGSLTAILRRQHHVIARGQVLAAGMTGAALRHRLRPDGPWQVLLPGVYLAFTGSATTDQRDMAALLYAGPRSVLTGYSALRRHGLADAPPAVHSLLVPPGIQRQSYGFVQLQRTARLPGQVCVSGDIRFAMIPRAVADAARALASPREVTALVAGAVQRRRCPIPLLAAELADGPVRGSALLRRALQDVTCGIRSVTEGDFRRLILRAGLPEPVFNASLYAGAQFIAVVDAWWPDAGVAAEVDSREWHLSPQDWERTLRRHASLSAHGVVVLHFTPSQLRREPGHVVATLRSALTASPVARPEAQVMLRARRAS